MKAMHRAVKNLDLLKLQYLVEVENVDINSFDEGGLTVLLRASWKSSEHVSYSTKSI